jgi:hypothetical protein
MVGGKDKRDECWLDVWAYRSPLFDFGADSGIESSGGSSNGGGISSSSQNNHAQQQRGTKGRKGGSKGADATAELRNKPTASGAEAAVRLKCHWEDEIRVLGLPSDIGCHSHSPLPHTPSPKSSSEPKCFPPTLL